MTTVTCHKTGKETPTFNINSSIGMTRTKSKILIFYLKGSWKARELHQSQTGPGVFKGAFRRVWGKGGIKCALKNVVLNNMEILHNR